ncbi:MAG: SusC/RagA family TonB-linked outer membrane protein, partial [Flammeovirgaceae bacterium]
MRRILLLSLLCFGLISSIEAQIVIKGKVSDAESPDAGLPGATVAIKGTTQGTTTDVDGAYTLQVPNKEAILVFSYIGMQTQEIKVGDQTLINVMLQSDATQLTEVIVVGYGTQKREDLTSSVTQLDGKGLAEVPAAYSFDGAIQGKAAGVNISTPSGTPGAAINVNIRGTTSIGASSQPLYVIDGVPIVARNNSALNSNIQPMNPLAEINPNDIESISVLKDASASAIYGSRGANGVIIITTKRGKAGKPKFSLGYYTGVSEISNTPELMNSRQWIEFYNAAAEFDGLGENFFNSSLGDPNDPNLPNYNAYDAIFQTGITHNVDFSVQGGNEKSKYFLSANYYNQDGIQKGLGFERISGRLNMDNSLSDRIGIGTSITVSRTNHDRTINENDEYGVVINAQAWDPTAPLVNEDGSYTNPFSYNGWWALENPLLIAEQYVNTGTTTRFLGSIYGTYDITDKFAFKTTWSLDYN